MVTRKEISDEILTEFISRVSASRNCARIVINRMELPFYPPRSYDIRCYINEDVMDAANLHGFALNQNVSNEEMLVFDMK